MAFNKDIHHRQSIRLHGYDYSQAGAYFITICTHQRQALFGHIADGIMVLNEAGMTAEKYWLAIPDHFPSVRLDEYVVMPNHLHGIIWIDPVGAQFIAPQTHIASNNPGTTEMGAINRAPTVGNIIRAFKARCTHAINQHNPTPGCALWQRNYHEHIIRNETAYLAIVEYIRSNPQTWPDDVP